MENLINSERQQKFSDEDIAIFKRYVEENNVYTENSFEFFEKNLDYFASRYTNDKFDCKAEQFHVNSNFWDSDEMSENVSLFEKFVIWRNDTVHPEKSEYVVKEEKYLPIESVPENIANIVRFLNRESLELYSCIDLLFYANGTIYQYLPHKNFLFTWNKNGKNIISRVSKILSQDLTESFVIIPIFVPIRKMLFFGEYGYREALIDYGCVLAKIKNFRQKIPSIKNLTIRQ